MNPPAIAVRGLTKAFAGLRVVAGVDLDVPRGEFFSLLGPSGCGKTTLLRLVAGFEQPDAGAIAIDGTDMAGVPPYARPVNMMFQSYALFPHMTVADNVAFGLKQDGLPAAEIRRRVGEMLELVRLSDLGGRKPHQLSGGQKQRVALARCLAKRPKVVLLDEPLAALDRRLREQTQFELVTIQQQVGITFVMVTHDQAEAMAMSSRIAVMEAGAILQLARPQEIYEFPASRAVAEFIGSANFFEGVAAGGGRVDCPALAATIVAPGAPDAEALAAGTPVTVMVRPEKLSITREPPDGAVNRVEGAVAEVAYCGGSSTYQVRLASGRMAMVAAANLRHDGAATVGCGDRVWLSWHPANAVVLP